MQTGVNYAKHKTEAINIGRSREIEVLTAIIGEIGNGKKRLKKTLALALVFTLIFN